MSSELLQVTDERTIGDVVRRERLRLGLDQRDLAYNAGVSLTALRRLELGKGSAVKTLLSVLMALGVQLAVPVSDDAPAERQRVSSPLRTTPDLQRREERVQYELHREVARKLRADPRSVINQALANLPQLRETVRGPLAHEWIDKWERALRRGTARELIELCLMPGEKGIDLRQVGPFAGVLTDKERMAAIRRARAGR